MKKSLVLGLMLVLGMFTQVNAQCACPEQENTLYITATATREVSPDTVEINIEVQTHDSKSMQVAMSKNNELSQKILEGLKKNINAEKGDYIKTSDFRADSLYNYINNKRTFDKYQVSNTVIVHTNAINSIPEIIENAINLGATGISNLNFSVSNYEKYRDELLTLAVQKAEKQATTAATAAKVSIKNIKNITVINNENAYGRYRHAAVNYKSAGSADELAAPIAPSIEPGVIKIQAGVNVVYRIK